MVAAGLRGINVLIAPAEGSVCSTAPLPLWMLIWPPLLSGVRFFLNMRAMIRTPRLNPYFQNLGHRYQLIAAFYHIGVDRPSAGCAARRQLGYLRPV